MRALLLVTLLAVPVVLTACQSSSEPLPPSKAVTTTTTATTAPAPGVVTGSVDVFDQVGKESITVSAVTILGAVAGGWMTVHVDDGGRPGAVAGRTHVAAGTTKDVVVHVSQASSDGRYWLVLHVDAGEPGVFDFPGPDVPVKAGADVVMKEIKLTP
ncbi:MAG TPA: hypothetical protein VFA94_06960 [Acidimicrobiales bacterium]|nr:hypothetical protein [Acidimicrobiales bacterium]